MMTWNGNPDKETTLETLVMLNVRLSSRVASSPFPKASGAQSRFSNGYKCSNSKYVQQSFKYYRKENNQNYISILVTFWQSGCNLSILQNSLYFRKNNRKC